MEIIVLLTKIFGYIMHTIYIHVNVLYFYIGNISKPEFIFENVAITYKFLFRIVSLV